MRIRIGLAVVALCLGASSSQAGLFGGSKLPEAIDSPIVRAKVKETHKVGAATVKMEKGKFGSPSWGGRWDVVLRDVHRPLPPHLHN